MPSSSSHALACSTLLMVACAADEPRTTQERQGDASNARGDGDEDGAHLDAGGEERGETPDAGHVPSDAGSYAAPYPPEDPGADAWQPVPADQVRGTCKLDPALLARADERLNVPWAAIRYGKLCHQFGFEDEVPGHVFSVTKTLGALVTGLVAHETGALPEQGAKTGPLSDEDRVDHWITNFDYNADARIGHVLGMVAQSESLAAGHKDMVYDSFGTTQINSLSDVLNAAIAQDTAHLGNDLEAFTQRFLFEKLGLTRSTWSDAAPDKVFGWSWVTDVRDMARVGLLMLHGGVWDGQRLLDAAWVYRMTHPAFEEANTGYGYLTWVNSASNYDFGGAEPPTLQDDSGPMLACAPVALHAAYPHGLSEASDCHYESPHSCAQMFDVGVWQAVGLGGQVIQGHPGLDLLLVARDLTPFGGGPDAPILLWDAVKPAVIAVDPRFSGNEEGFCEAYSGNAYAPDFHD